MPRRLTDKEAAAVMIPKIVEALYPVLIPIEQQDCKIQAKHREKITEMAKMVWWLFSLPDE